MPLSLTFEPASTLPGLTLFSDSALGPWAKPTGIYVPPSADIDSGTINVVLWLHGWYVPKIEQLFFGDRAAVRQQVLSSGKNVILVAPWLGNGQPGGGSTFNVSSLKGNWGELYLNQVLGALAVGRDPTKYDPPWKRTDLFQVATPGLRLGKLVIACHSGGGAGMRNLVGALGRYRWNLRECWGFDCLYGINATPDDATFWYNWVNSSDGRPLYISYGSSTVPQSVKLYLMGEGLATSMGARRDPEGPDMARLKVTLGISSTRYIDDLMGLDKLLLDTTPTPKRPPPLGNKFVEQAASNLRKNAGWPADLMEMHYRIARDGLRDRLKGATFL